MTGEAMLTVRIAVQVRSCATGPETAVQAFGCAIERRNSVISGAATGVFRDLAAPVDAIHAVGKAAALQTN